MKQHHLISLFLLMVLGLLVACSAQVTGNAGTNAGTAAESDNEPAVNEPETSAQATEVPAATGEEDLVLLWEGVPLGEGAEGEACGRLEIQAGGEASFGPCDGPLTTAAVSAPRWDEIVARFAPFNLEGEESRLSFQGQGEVADPAWQRALASWARASYGELASGRACAACRTILTWSFGPLAQDPQSCSVLWVTDYGYASLGTVPCEGGQTEVIAQGWLETAEWAQLEEWLRSRAPLSLGENGATSLLGQGTQEMSADEQAALAAWAEAVAARLRPASDAPEAATAESAAMGEGLCLEVPRPALALFIPGEGYLITDPLSGKSCTTTLDGDIPGNFQAAGDAVYYTVLEDDLFVIKRVAQDGTTSLLPFTAVNQDDALLYHSFVVADDGSRIAWGAASAGADYSGPQVSHMWVASIDGSDVVAPLPELQTEGENRYALAPVRFSADNSTLYYTLQPVGLGGTWNAFVGRYDNLYALRLNTDAEPTLIFDCAGDHVVLCIGDFYEVEGQVGSLAYVDGQAVVIMNGLGDVLNTINLDDDYVGYPTFGPGGELVFYGADLPDDPNASILPEQGTLYRVAPPTAPHEVLASDPGLLLPQGWLDATHVAVAYNSGGDNWGAAIVGLDGSIAVLQSEPNASFVDVLP